MLAKQLIVSSTLHAAGDTAATLGQWLHEIMTEKSKGFQPKKGDSTRSAPGSSYNLGYNSYNWGYPIIRPFVVQDIFVAPSKFTKTFPVHKTHQLLI